MPATKLLTLTKHVFRSLDGTFSFITDKRNSKASTHKLVAPVNNASWIKPQCVAVVGRFIYFNERISKIHLQGINQRENVQAIAI